ncbi:hypothetical protein [Legionella genomosp. 1]|uniref:hypothetical protein n=1 Tax=Legionella genomosp. 1 TaxID=1093625 RepID=UPI0010554135|nr:hypothetical protein [Legionella genomosp. 1]
MPLNTETVQSWPIQENETKSSHDDRSDSQSLLKKMEKDHTQMHQEWQEFRLKAEKLLEKIADEHVKLTKAITEQFKKEVDNELSIFESTFAEVSKMNTPGNASVSLSNRFFNKLAEYDAELCKHELEKAASDSLSKMTIG